MSKYGIDGREYPSVTTILGVLAKPALIQWASNVAVDYLASHSSSNDMFTALVGTSSIRNDEFDNARNAYKDKSTDALDTGSVVHNAIDAYIKTGSYHLDEGMVEENRCMESFIRFTHEHNVEFVENEMTVFDPVKRYAGTLDAVAKIDGKRYVIDFKTSSAIYSENWMQVAAYRGAYNKMKRKSGYGIAVLRLDKNEPKYELKLITDQKKISRYYKAFTHLVAYYYLIAKRRLKDGVD